MLAIAGSAAWLPAQPAVSLSSGVPEGAGTLHAMMERLAKAPQRRDFKTVPMILRSEPATHLVEGPPPLIGLHREGLCDRGTRRVRVALGPFWLFEEGLRSGMLVRVPKRYDAPPVPIYLLYTASHMLLRRVRTFIEFISATFAETAPYL